MNKTHSFVLSTLITASLTHLSADDSVDQQIATIQKATAAERVQLMNRFKVNLANMNEEDQIKAMSQLQKQLQIRVSKERPDSTGEMQMRMQEMHQVQQMNQMQQNMGQVQNMNMGGSQGRGR